jgi:hypothetical protein
LGGTYNTAGLYEDKGIDKFHSAQFNNGMQVRFDTLIHGIVEKPYINNPFTRFHVSIEEYPQFHDDIDDISFQEYDNWERLKKFDPVEGSTVGETFAVPLEDND